MRCGKDIDHIKLTLCDEVGNIEVLGGIGGGSAPFKVDEILPWDKDEYINGFQGTIIDYVRSL